MLHTCVSTKGWRFCWFIDNTVTESSLFAGHCTRYWLQWKSKLGSCPHSAESLEKWLDTELVSKSEGTDGGKCWEGKTDWNDRKTKADLLRAGVRGSPSKEWEGASLTEWRNEPLSCPSREVVSPSSTSLPPPKHSIPEQYTGRDSTGLLLQCWSRSGSEHPSAGSPSQAQ